MPVRKATPQRYSHGIPRFWLGHPAASSARKCLCWQRSLRPIQEALR
jgi:hypothetical protein